MVNSLCTHPRVRRALAGDGVVFALEEAVFPEEAVVALRGIVSR